MGLKKRCRSVAGFTAFLYKVYFYHIEPPEEIVYNEYYIVSCVTGRRGQSRLWRSLLGRAVSEKIRLMYGGGEKEREHRRLCRVRR